MVSTRQRAHSEKAVVTQTQGLPRDEAVSLPLPGEGSGETACFLVEGKLAMVAELREEVERLRSIRVCEQEIASWS